MTGERAAAFAQSKIGQGYIYGAKGQTCTAAFRRQQAAQYPDQAQNILVTGAKWDGRPVWDCAQLTRFAAKEVGFEALDPVLNGTTALAISMEDEIAPARVITDFMKKNPKLAFSVKAGFVDGEVVDADTIKQLGELPGKDVLVAMVLGTMNAPIAALARAINAIAEQKGAPAEAAEAAPAAE